MAITGTEVMVASVEQGLKVWISGRIACCKICDLLNLAHQVSQVSNDLPLKIEFPLFYRQAWCLVANELWSESEALCASQSCEPVAYWWTEGCCVLLPQ